MTRLIQLLRRGALALLLAALVAPLPARAPADDARAFAIALGVICAVDGTDSGTAHSDGHCALCIVSATGATRALSLSVRDEKRLALSLDLNVPRPAVDTSPKIWRARAPPSLFV